MIKASEVAKLYWSYKKELERQINFKETFKKETSSHGEVMGRIEVLSRIVVDLAVILHDFDSNEKSRPEG